MLPIGGALTAMFVLYRWGIDLFLEEIKIGMENINVGWKSARSISNVLFILSSLIVVLIILNEVFELIFGNSLQQMAGF